MPELLFLDGSQTIDNGALTIERKMPGWAAIAAGQPSVSPSTMRSSGKAVGASVLANATCTS